MATMTRAQIEKIVHNVLDEEYGGKLGADDETDSGATPHARGVTPPPDDDPEVPEGDDEAEPGVLPAAVTDAVEALCSTLSSEQAEALATLFTAMGDTLDDEDADTEPPDSDADDTPSRRRRHLSRG
ncbi:MAG TPA: hypothetical protein VID28_04040 [Methylomirabilota bacterium]